MAGEPVTIWGDGKLVRDYLYAGDLAEAVYQLVDLEHWDRTVNIGYGKGHTVRAILKIVSEFFPSVHVVSNPARAFDIQNLVLDTSLMRSLCHVPLLSLDSGIRRTIEHLMAESGSASLSQTPVSRILQN
jgi:UDP-glucose 4-epimerase